MNNITELIGIITSYGGSATLDQIIDRYKAEHPMVIFNEHKVIFEKTLKNTSLVRFNKGSLKWEYLSRPKAEYLYVSDNKYFKTIRKAMLEVFNMKVNSGSSFFELKELNNYAWFPKIYNPNPKWSNSILDDGKIIVENNNFEKAEDNNTLQKYLRFTFVYEKDSNGNSGYRFAGVFKQISIKSDGSRVYELIDDKVKIINNKSPLLICRIAYMKNYNGISPEDSPINGGSYVHENNDAYEKYNFRFNDDGHCYGFVETKYKNGEITNNEFARSIHIENLDPRYSNKNEISGVTVVFVALSPIKRKTVIVGWYENATVYRERIVAGNDLVYMMKCKGKDAYLIKEDNREFEMPLAQNNDFGIGQSNYWYIQKNNKALEFELQINKYLDSVKN